MKECVHCFEKADTKDHVFPSAWYTSDTPNTVQRWTVPSCRKCNEEFGKTEQELLIKLVPCIDPAKPGVAGLKERVYATLGIGQEHRLKPQEFKVRKAKAAKLYAEFFTYHKEMPIYPNFGPHIGTPPEEQHAVFIPKAQIESILGKIFRGAEYKLNNGRLLKPPYKLEIFDAINTEMPDVEKIFNQFGRSEYLGPGFKLVRVAGTGEVILYKATIWDTWTAYGSIDSKD